jgi:choline dehydrogenase-like flavoprotein
VYGVFDHDVEPWLGPPMTAMSKRFAHVRGAYGFVLECAPVHPGLASVAIPWFGAEEHARDLGALRRTANVIAITRDRDPGRIDDADVPNVRFRLSRFDGAHLTLGVAMATRVLFAAGAREVYTAHTPPLRIARDEATEAGLRRFGERVTRAGHAPNRIALFSAHQMGTARMSAYSREGVVDERGAVFATRGLLVADGSTFPRASGVNPMLTIMAMAHRIAALHA